MDDNELGRRLGESATAPPPSAETLHAIVRRSHRRARAALAGAVVVALVAVGIVATSGRGSDEPSTAVLAGDPRAFESTEAAFAPEGMEGLEELEPAQPVSNTRPPLERLFLRSSGGVAIRAYVHQPRPRPDCPPDRSCPPPPPPECVPSAVLRAELSNEGAVRAGVAPVWPSSANGVAVLRTGIFGVAERSAAQWVAVHAGPTVERVRARFVDGSSDEMEPVRGYAVLAHTVRLPDVTPGDQSQRPRPEAVGTVEGLDGSGRVVASQQLSPGSRPQAPEGCVRVGDRGNGGPGAEGGRRRGRSGGPDTAGQPPEAPNGGPGRLPQR